MKEKVSSGNLEPLPKSLSEARAAIFAAFCAETRSNFRQLSSQLRLHFPVGCGPVAMSTFTANSAMTGYVMTIMCFLAECTALIFTTKTKISRIAN